MGKLKSRILDRRIIAAFSKIPDPRVTGRCDHRLVDIIVISVCAVLCGCDNWGEIEEFARQREGFFKEFLELKNGIPSHDTFSRVFSLLKPDLFEEVFFDWINSVSCSLKKEKTIAIDGKIVAGTNRKFGVGGKSRLHLLNVLCHESGLCIGQKRAKSSGAGEIGAALDFLDEIELSEVLVTMDAGLTSHRIAKSVTEKNGDYLMPVKGNQRWYREEIEAIFLKKTSKRASLTEEESNRGRKERRVCEVFDVDKTISEKLKSHFLGVKAIIKVIRKRVIKDTRYTLQERNSDGTHSYRKNTNKERETTTTAYYVCSRKISAKEAMEKIRSHWKIENKLHWSLDVVFLEDNSRVRNRVVAQNLATVRKIAFNLIKMAPGKGSQKLKMKRASWNVDCLREILFS